MNARWYDADRVDLLSRIYALEHELKIAAELIRLREERAEHRSPVVADLQRKWRDLLAEQPAAPEVAA